MKCVILDEVKDLLLSRGGALLLALVIVSACERDSRRLAAVDSAAARRLDGVWTIEMRLERPITLESQPERIPRSVRGEVAFLALGHARQSFPQMDTPTHLGVYDIGLADLGFPSSVATETPLAMARMVVGARPAADSIYLVLNPGTTRYAILMSGAFHGDSIVGTWASESFLGGGGAITLRRHSHEGRVIPP